MNSRRPGLDLFLISFLILFLELACIRWLGSTVVFLTFFSNVILTATFLGMSVGCMIAGRAKNFSAWTLPLLGATVALAIVTLNLYEHSDVAVGVGGNESGSPQLIYFGTEARKADLSQFVVPVEVVAGVFFTLTALVFVGLGQVMGRAFDAILSRVGAYTINVLGSLAGIAVFAGMSWMRQTPLVWFALAVALCLYFARPWSGVQITAAVVTMFLVGATSYVPDGFHHRPTATGWPQLYWSPYYKIAYDAKWGAIDTNNIGHQQMVAVAKEGPGYLLPHLLNRDAGGSPFKDIMIIGAGSGNDVSAALQMGDPAGHIDAVEIDPVIAAIGTDDHPEKPYHDARVTLHNDDGRSFVRKTGRQYDYISYALVDSLVLHSGYSSLRLESFLFTRQALSDIKSKLKPGGVFAMYNFYRQGWVVARLTKMAREVFGVEPIVVSMPYQASIVPTETQGGHITFLLVGNPVGGGGSVPALDAIRAKFQSAEGNFWIHDRPAVGAAGNGFNPRPPGTNLDDDAAYFRAHPRAALPWRVISPAEVKTDDASVIVPTDDWPFLYLRNRTIPRRPTLSGMIMVGVLSIAILLAFAWPTWFGSGHAGERFNVQMFFLGAGFMLLETKGVVHMALLFGSTWIVNSVVFFAVLVMILIANLFVLALRPQRLWPWYALLAASLIAGAIVPMSYFLAMSPTPRIGLSCGLFFAPVFFAGVIFATSLRDSPVPHVDIGSNIAGVILGALAEQLSLVIGFSKLLVVALLLYGISAAAARTRLFAPRTAAP